MQIFEGLVYPRSASDELMETGHTMGSIFTVNQSTPLLFLCLVSLILAILQLGCGKYLARLGFTFKSYDIQVDEDLPIFFNAVKTSEKEWALAEHYYYKKHYGMNMIAAPKVEKL